MQGALLFQPESEPKRQSRLPFPIVHFRKLLRKSDGSILRGTPTVLIKLSEDDSAVEDNSIIVLEFRSWDYLKEALIVSRARFPIVAVSKLENVWEPEYLVTYLSAVIVLTPKPSLKGDLSMFPGTMWWGYQTEFQRFFETIFWDSSKLVRDDGIMNWVRKGWSDKIRSQLARWISETRYAIAILRYFQTVPYDATIKDGRLVFSNHPAFRELAKRWSFEDVIQKWNGQPVGVLKSDKPFCRYLQETPYIRLAPQVQEVIREALSTVDVNIAKAPFAPIPENMRLAVLDTHDFVIDRATGTQHRVFTGTKRTQERGYAARLHDDGTTKFVPVRRTKWEMTVSVVPNEYYTESDIDEFLRRYKLPEVPDVSTFADKYDKALSIIDELEVFLRQQGQALRPFQRDDLVRLLVKGFGIYAADPGLGKTIVGWMFALGAMMMHKTAARVLIVAPQDIISHWINEAIKFFGYDFVSDIYLVKTVQDAINLRRLGKLLPKDAPIIALTYYEALRHSLPEDYNRRHGLALGKINADGNVKERLLNRKEKCPICGRYSPSPRDGTYCHDDCPDPTPWAFRSRDAAYYLKDFVKGGVLIVDEATLAKSVDSLRGVAARRLVTAKCRLLLTGTPIKNMLTDLPTLLQLAAKPKSDAYPFPPEDEGVRRFSKQFLVIEQDLETGKTRTVPEPTDKQRLTWLLSGIILRRRKDQTGEDIQPFEIELHTVPMTRRQIAWYKAWVDEDVFDYWFAKTKERAASPLDRMLSLLTRLNFVVCHPTSPTALGEPFPLNEFVRDLPEPSDVTHRNMLVAKLAENAVKQDGYCIVYAQTIGVFKFLQQLLKEAGVRVHSTIKFAKDGKAQSLPPSERVAVIRKFEREGGVLLASISAMAYGHDMPFCSQCVIHSLPLAYDQFVQSINRIHRLTSPKPVTAHVIITPHSIDHYLFELLSRKHAASKQLIGSTIDEFGTITPAELAKVAQQATEHVDEVPVEG